MSERVTHADTCDWASVTNGCACAALGPATSVETAAALVVASMRAEGLIFPDDTEEMVAVVVDGMRDLLELACKALCLLCLDDEPVPAEGVPDLWVHQRGQALVACFASAFHDMRNPADQPVTVAPKAEAQ